MSTTNLFDACATIYDAMFDESEESTEGRFWKGALTKLFIERDVNIGNYTPVTRKLIAMGSIEQVKRGGGGSDSVWLLITAPTVELYDASASNSTAGLRLTKKTTRDKAIENLTQRVNKLELIVARLAEEFKPR